MVTFYIPSSVTRKSEVGHSGEVLQEGDDLGGKRVWQKRSGVGGLFVIRKIPVVGGGR